MMNKEDVDVIMNKDDDAIMSWHELFFHCSRKMNEGCLIKEEDISMLSNNFYNNLLLENINII
jgi:hypothetical protein